MLNDDKIIIWLVVDLPLWKIIGRWDDEILNIWENKKNVPNHQPAKDYTIVLK